MKKHRRVKHIATVAGISLVSLALLGSPYILPRAVEYFSGSEQPAVLYNQRDLPLNPFTLTPTPGPWPMLTPPPDDNDEGTLVISSFPFAATPTPTRTPSGTIDDKVDTPNLTPEPNAVQAGFLSDIVSSYSAHGFGGMKASLAQPSFLLNYFYLILKDSNGKLVKFNPYEHSAKYTLMEMSHDDAVYFTWNNRLLPPGKYTAIIAKGPQVLFNDSNLQILEQRQFEVKPYDFSANNAQNISADGYSMSLEGDNIVIKSPSPSNNRLIELKVYDMEGIILYEQAPTIFFRDYRFKKPSGDFFKVEAVITYSMDTPARVERKVLLAASYLPAMQNPINNPIVR